MKNDIKNLQEECKKLRIKIIQTETIELQSLQNDIHFERISTLFGLTSTKEIENAKNRERIYELAFKDKLNKKIEEIDIEEMKDVYEKLKEAIYTVMDTMEDNHYKFMDVLNSYKSRNYD